MGSNPGISLDRNGYAVRHEYLCCEECSHYIDKSSINRSRDTYLRKCELLRKLVIIHTNEGMKMKYVARTAYTIEKDASCYTKAICTANYSFNYALK